VTATERASGAAAGLRLVRRVLAYEVGMWRNLYRWVFRRPVTFEPDAVALGYAGMLTPFLIAFIAVSAVEIPVLHLLLPWETARLVADILGVYGLLWMVGLFAANRAHPHIVGRFGLRIRNGHAVDLLLAWDDVASMRTRGRDLPGRTVQLDRTGPDPSWRSAS
jgi:hypothetical protein